ncbi:hypothetical protein EXN66_Car011185 [Channa argus]|uniref:Uncharacterized protein n=1 Tax=Channa argus TaxID=215402 RepID=A0A6G1PZ62_CHAAH|nr:hypothetical protein EXN66_Car011185 [Channa argus]
MGPSFRSYLEHRTTTKETLPVRNDTNITVYPSVVTHLTSEAKVQHWLQSTISGTAEDSLSLSRMLQIGPMPAVSSCLDPGLLVEGLVLILYGKDYLFKLTWQPFSKSSHNFHNSTNV